MKRNLCRAVTKISSCRVKTTSRQGMKELRISFGYIFLLFSSHSTGGSCSYWPGKSLTPGSWWQPWCLWLATRVGQMSLSCLCKKGNKYCAITMSFPRSANVLLLTTVLDQSAHEKSLSYCKMIFLLYKPHHSLWNFTAICFL